MPHIKNSNIVLSIIIPVYNIEQYIHKCLNSIKDHNVEIIIINDCSTDNSHNIINEFIINTSLNIKYINLQENIGTLAVRILGFQSAISQFVMFLDADDWLEHTALNKIVDIINDNQDIDLIQYGYCYNNGNNIWCPSKKSQVFNDNNQFIPYNIYGNYFMCQFVYNKSLFPESAISVLERLNFKLLMYEDVFVNHLILPKVKKIYKLNENIYHYYIREDSITNTQNTARIIKNLHDSYFVLNHISEQTDEYNNYYNYQAKYWKNKILLIYSLSHDKQLISEYNKIYDDKINNNLFLLSSKVKIKYLILIGVNNLLPLGTKRRLFIKFMFNKIFNK